MKIGEFAKKHGVSIDTVRHYMEKQLLIADRQGAQYEFDERCSEDLAEILWLKSLGFTLPEIEKLLIIKRFTGLKTPGDRVQYTKLFEAKRHKLILEIERLKLCTAAIEKRIKDVVKEPYLDRKKIGVPLDFIPLMSCPSCGKALVLKSGSIEENMVMKGELSCGCGYKLFILEGIITTGPELNISDLNQDMGSENEYIEKTSPKFINHMYKSREWAYKKIVEEDLAEKVVLEIGTGSGMLLRRINSSLHENTFYIAVDNEMEPLYTTKRTLEHNYVSAKYVFINCNVEELPLKDHAADMVLDYWGSSCNNFLRAGYLVKEVKRKLKPKGKWMAAHLYFNKNSKSTLQYPAQCRPYFYIENITKAYRECGFKTLEAKEMGFVDEGGEFESFLIPGDKAYEWCFFGVDENP